MGAKNKKLTTTNSQLTPTTSMIKWQTVADISNITIPNQSHQSVHKYHRHCRQLCIWTMARFNKVHTQR